MQTGTSDFWKLFKPSACSLKLRGASHDEVFRELVENAVAAKVLAEQHREAAWEALRAREALASTGVGQGVAIPHVKLQGLEEAVVSLSVHLEGVAWGSLDGEPAHLFFLVLRPDEDAARHDPERHLEMMRWISQLARDADFRNFARAAGTRTDLVQLLKEMSGLGA